MWHGESFKPIPLCFSDGRWLFPSLHFTGVVALEDPTFCGDLVPVLTCMCLRPFLLSPTWQVKPSSLHLWCQQMPVLPPRWACHFNFGFSSLFPLSFPLEVFLFYSDICYSSQVSRWFLMGEGILPIILPEVEISHSPFFPINWEVLILMSKLIFIFTHTRVCPPNCSLLID